MMNCKEIQLTYAEVIITITSSLSNSAEIFENIAGKSNGRYNLKTTKAKSDLFFDDDKRCPIIFYENREYWFVVRFSESKILHSQDVFEIVDKSEDNKQFRFRFNSKNYVGIVNLSLFGIYDCIIEVESVKIDYQTEYNNLLLKISELGIDLATRASSIFSTSVIHSENINDNEYLLNSKLAFIKSKILSGEFENLYSSFLKKPLSKIKGNKEEKFVWELQSFDLSDYLDGLSSGIITTSNGIRLPLKMRASINEENIDTIENQFIKHLLDTVIYLLTDVLVKLTQGNYFSLKLEINECLLRCEKIRSNVIFESISKLSYFPSKSNALHNKHPYKELYRIYMLLFYEVQIADNATSLSMTTSLKDLPKLYEYWCFLNMVEILSDKFGKIDLIAQGFIHYSENNFCFIISPSSNGLQFSLAENKMIKLYYSKSYNSSNIIYNGRSYSHSLNPDISAELFYNNVLIAIIHFDAKYKMEQSDTFKNEDLDKMHTYKDAILATIGAYILYPGKQTQNYIQEELNQEMTNQFFPSVGAFVLNINRDDIANERFALYTLLDRFASIGNDLTLGGIFEENQKRYNYLKRLID